MIIHINGGAIQGNEAGGVASFKGVPFAAPPVGGLRFAPPQPAAPWTGVRDATEHGAIAPQAPSRLRAAMGDSSVREQNEDCLTLSIWAPSRAEACPVLVWLHGGAWTGGAGSLDWYDGSTLAREGGMAVVCVNYRLGAFGYLRHPAISAEDLGTLDQVLALQWVRDNIAAFGGDPARVTVGGQSAGAANIGRLALHRAARPLFQRAILQSGGFGRTPLARPEAEASGAVFIRSLGIDPDASDVVSQLRALPTAAILEAQGAFARSRARFGDSSPPFMPVLDTAMTEAELLSAIADAMGSAEILIGATHDESHAFFAGEPADPPEGALEALFARIGGPEETVARYAARRPGGSKTDLLSDFSTQHTFLRPTMRLAAAMAERGGRRVRLPVQLVATL